MPFLYIFISCSHSLLLGSAQHPQKALPFESSKGLVSPFAIPKQVRLAAIIPYGAFTS